MTRLHYASTKDSDMLYLVRHRITAPFFFLEHEGVKRIFLSCVDIEAFKDKVQEESKVDVEAMDVGLLRCETSKKSGDPAGNLAKLILETYYVEGKIRVPNNFPVSIADSLRTEYPQLTVGKDWCPERILKSLEEVVAIRENFEYTKKAFELVEQILKDSEIVNDTLLYKSEVLTSEFLKREGRKLLLDFDLENPAGLIISCGRQATMPHHEGSGPILPNETIIVDIFPQSTKNHYFADMTRTYVKGKPSNEVMKMYEAVKEAQKASLSALKPGLTGREIYEVSANSIKDAGFDVGQNSNEEGYIHSLGHGLGIDVHEKPNLGPNSDDVLEEGMVVTIEPGLYYKKLGGVRIEDTVLITKEGHKNLTNYPQNWIIQ